ncbi:MAG: DUF4160 domain-containing protein [Kiritimatiellaeota bacterium]|nr:DUF4160 domain-containing protein [Kiritimatiellota bacterium]
MPTISFFYGVLIKMFFKDIEKHRLPHIHVEYQDTVAVYAIKTGKVISGKIPLAKHKLVVAWMEIHKDALLANWKLAVAGEELFTIKGLDS